MPAKELNKEMKDRHKATKRISIMSLGPKISNPQFKSDNYQFVKFPSKLNEFKNNSIRTTQKLIMIKPSEKLVIQPNENRSTSINRSGLNNTSLESTELCMNKHYCKMIAKRMMDIQKGRLSPNSQVLISIDDIKQIDPDFYKIYSDAHASLEASKTENKTVKLKFGEFDYEKYSRCKNDLLKRFNDVNKNCVDVYKTALELEQDFNISEDISQVQLK